ncbi:MAG: RHS repeat protein, partial [Candidatus Koribacter versatilis]|nr:RHS repeat protein [Candidatus Koribacter versatilis]
MDLTLYYNSAVWTTRKTSSTVTGATFNGDRDFPSYGFRLGYGYMEYDSTDDFYTLTASDGSKRRLVLVTAGTYESDDSTYMRFYPAQGILRYKSGVTVFYELIPDLTNDDLRRPYQIQDTNGNFISITYKKVYGTTGSPVRAITTADIPAGTPRPINDTVWHGQEIATIQDTLNRTVSFSYSSYLLSSISDGTRTWNFTFSSYTLKYYFTFTITNSPSTSTSINALSSVTFPNSTSTKYIYSATSGVADWGMVNRIEQRSSNNTLRSYTSYNYPVPNSAAPLSDHPTFTTQTVSPNGSATNSWTYSTTKTSGVVTGFSITDPTSLKTKTNLDSNGLVTSVVLSNGATTYRTITNTWTGTPGSNPRVTAVVTTLNDTGQQSKVTLAYDSYGNVNDVKEYDYGLVLTRQITTTYSTDTTLVSDRILDRPAQIRVYGGAGNLKARTDLDYDTYTGNPLTDRTGTIAGHSTAYTTSKLDRGNVTKVTRYTDPVALTGPIVRNSSYDILGNLVAADLDCCNRRTWSFIGDDSYSFPSSTTSGSGVTLTHSFTYYGTGLLHTVVDPNSQTTTFQYDSADRTTSVTRPNGSAVTTSYDDAAGSPTVTQTTPIDATPKNSVSISTFNGLGWLTKQQLKDNGGTVISTIDRSYDAAGRLTSVTNPYVSTPTGNNTTYSYDGMGRLSKTIPPDGSSGSNNWTYAYSGNQVTLTDPASKQRRNYTDALGRLLRVDEPGGTSGAGTITISGAEGSLDLDPPGPLTYDAGAVSITINGFTKSVNYGRSSTSSNLASALAAAFNADSNSPVTAGASGSAVSFTAKESGVYTNFTFTTASATSQPELFGGPSFAAAPDSGSLTGGVDSAGTPSLSHPFATYYTYNVLDDLTQVAQGTQTRTYVYNGLGQLTSATTPESGAVSYSYT